MKTIYLSIVLVLAGMCCGLYLQMHGGNVSGPPINVTVFPPLDLYVADVADKAIYGVNIVGETLQRRLIYKVPDTYGIPHNVLLPKTCDTTASLYISTTLTTGITGPAKILDVNPVTFQLNRAIGGTELKSPTGMALRQSSGTSWDELIVADTGIPAIHRYNRQTGQYKGVLPVQPEYLTGLQDLMWSNGCSGSLFILAGKKVIDLDISGTYTKTIIDDATFSHAWGFGTNYSKGYLYICDINKNIVRQCSFSGQRIRDIAGMSQPTGVVVLKNGHVVVSTQQGKLFQFGSEGEPLGSYSGMTSPAGLLEP